MKDVFSIIEAVNKRLMDKESKEIYANKIMFNITNDYTYLRNIFEIVNKTYSVLPDFKHHEKQPKVIFGCGKYGKLIKRCFPEIDWKCYVDNNAQMDMVVEGVPVISVENLKKAYPEAYIVVSPRFGYENIKKQLQQNFFCDENIFLYGEKQDFLAEKVYFDLPYLAHSDNEIFVDAGVLDGETSRAFISWSQKKYEHIYMFEPNVDLFEKIHKNMKNISKDSFTLHGKGLWNCEDTIDFFVDSEHLAGANFIKETGNVCSARSVSVIDLDSMLLDVPVSFIKMDIEGAEKKALQGCEKIIRKYHPKLAISIYHNSEDLWEIPQVILESDSEYNFYIRHYTLGDGDTVLYAV